MSARQRLPLPVECIRLRRINADFGFVDVRLPDVHLKSIRVEMIGDGRLRITAPSSAGKDGVMWPCFALQPGAREAVEEAIHQAWGRSR